MTAKNYDWLGTLEENPKDVYLDSTTILLKLMDNVIQNPSNPKFRSIRLSNPTVTKKLMPAIGALECLFEIGFEEDDDKLTLPENISLEQLKKIREEINSRRNNFLSSSPRQSTAPPSGSGETVTTRTHSEKPLAQNLQNTKPVRPSPTLASTSENLTASTTIPSPSRSISNASGDLNASAAKPVPDASGKLSSSAVTQSPSRPVANVSGNQNSSTIVKSPISIGNASGNLSSSVTMQSSANVSSGTATTQSHSRSIASVSENTSTPTTSQSSVRASTTVSVPVSSGASARVPAVPSIQQNKNQSSRFLRSIWNYSYSVLKYEDPALQRKARELIPIKQLEAAAEAKMYEFRKSLKKTPGGSEQDVDVNELLLLELLDWFKNSFFTWVDAPKCNVCSGETAFAGLSENPAELTETSRVEVHVCKLCNERTLFPRHHDPYKLLETRRGRCGEWASCFALFCRTMGWETRHVAAETDHLWAEVYSMSQKRWLHCDPCENIWDQPLIYEKGWGTKLNYVIAYSYDDVQDVTWRYTTEHHAILSRRTLCSEQDLQTTLLQIRLERQKNISPARRAFLTQRVLAELVEFLTPPKPAEADFQGRSSGSLAWRLARGETGAPSSITPYVWEPSSSEVSSCQMQVKYSASQNKYIRVSTGEELKGWENGVLEANSVFRKEEKDWKKVYLASTEGSEKGLIKWKVDCSKSGLSVDTVSVKCVGTTFESGKVTLTLCSEEFCMPVPSGDSTFETDALKGSESFTLTAELKGGKVWQHAQLFRQDIDSVTEYPFSLLVKFKRA